MTKLLYFNGQLMSQLMTRNYTESIADAIIKLSLKEGDYFELFPFNFFGEEEGFSKKEAKEYHTKLKIVAKKISMAESVNGLLRTKIEIFLEPA